MIVGFWLPVLLKNTFCEESDLFYINVRLCKFVYIFQDEGVDPGVAFDDDPFEPEPEPKSGLSLFELKRGRSQSLSAFPPREEEGQNFQTNNKKEETQVRLHVKDFNVFRMNGLFWNTQNMYVYINWLEQLKNWITALSATGNQFHNLQLKSC